MTNFKITDFPIGSFFYIYKEIDLQVNPYTRIKGSKKYIKKYGFIKLQVSNHLTKTLIQCSSDDIDCGWSICSNSNSNCIVYPEWFVENIKSEISLHPNKYNLAQIIDEKSDLVLIGTTSIQLKKPYSNKLKFNQYSAI